jgi:predicted DNA-binding transcriptional regulator YafY
MISRVAVLGNEFVRQGNEFPTISLTFGEKDQQVSWRCRKINDNHGELEANRFNAAVFVRIDASHCSNKPMARNEQLIRQHKILQILERVRFGKTIEEIQAEVVDELGLSSIHVRTLKRDLEALQAAGIDVDCHDSPRGKVWKLGPLAKTATKISFSATELISLSLGRQLMFPLAGTPFWQGIESFWNKIQEEVPETVLTHYEKFRKTLSVLGMPAKSYEKQHGIIKTINRAIVEHRLVEIEYESPAKPKRMRMIEPHRIVLFQSSLYVIATDCEDEDMETKVRSFKVDRMSKALITDKYFKPPSDEDIDQFVGNTMQMFVRKKTNQTYVIRVNPKAARWVLEDPLHAEQQVKQLDDGSIELTVEAVHDMEIIPRVLSMGDNAEIVSPKQARQEIAKIIKQMSGMYDG